MQPSYFKIFFINLQPFTVSYNDERIYEILMDNMNKYNADISVCSIKKVYDFSYN